jgi:hypothetical protein
VVVPFGKLKSAVTDVGSSRAASRTVAFAPVNFGVVDA